MIPITFCFDGRRVSKPASRAIYCVKQASFIHIVVTYWPQFGSLSNILTRPFAAGFVRRSLCWSSARKPISSRYPSCTESGSKSWKGADAAYGNSATIVGLMGTQTTSLAKSGIESPKYQNLTFDDHGSGVSYRGYSARTKNVRDDETFGHHWVPSGPVTKAARLVRRVLQHKRLLEFFDHTGSRRSATRLNAYVESALICFTKNTH